MNFHFANTVEQDGKKFGTIKEGSIDESGRITYTTNQTRGDKEEGIPIRFSDSFDEQIAAELMKRLFGIDIDRKQLQEEAWDKARKLHGISDKTVNKKDHEVMQKEIKKEVPSNDAPIKIGVDVTKLNDDEFIEYTRRRASMNKQFERFKAIKNKLRKILEGNTYNDKMFNMFIKLHDIEKRGFFNRTQTDDSIIDEAVLLYGSM